PVGRRSALRSLRYPNPSIVAIRLQSAVIEDRGRRHDARPHAALEVAPHAREDRIGAAVGVEALDVEAERARPLPQVRVLQARLIGVERGVHLREAALEAGRLRRARRRPGARVLRSDGEVAEDPAPGGCGEALLERAAVRALVV